ncbi:cyclin-like protein [Aspergillus sclerotioniger CBS 115572]|uniref:RNA polymerase II holoenzyme cyclin-like subunit n=1 Tax=Aspergillus sclerotioniger CBS 115572 TaxID=1450535 RepID=A0A317WRF3_9EURO|nr:cyclin-like protein [Aspergillus sclerotioniger CBS 115572]PWY87872.1 cyclin-like protein [Aspergillus sclerotioniger CBS 115572]
MESPADHFEIPPVPAPSNPVLLKTQAHWYFTDEELTRTPSQLDGMAMEAEHMSRSKGVNFINQVGIMLKLPQLTLSTAAVYFHRFFMRHSMVDLPQRPGTHPYTTAAAALFLATKVEENIRRMKELVVACCRVGQKQPNMIVDEQSKDFWRWRDTILVNEDIVLEALCFDLQLEQPYRILYDFLGFFTMQDNKPLRNAAWAFVNDSVYTVLCLQFPARTIAAAALYAAAQHCDVGFEDDGLGRPWWEQIDVDLTQVRRACMRMAKLYETNATNRNSPYYLTTPISTDEGTEKTRIPRAGGPTDTTRQTDNARETDAVNGRKRSREPDEVLPSALTTDSIHSQDPGPAPQNGGRSPKRSRTDTEGASIVKAPSSRVPKAHAPSSVSSFSHDRQHANGHGPPASYSHAYPTPSRHPHPLPPPPRPFPRRDSTSSRPGGANPGMPVDPIQQRIDEIVQQNMPSQGGPGRTDRRPLERPRGDRAPEPEAGRRRRPSGSTDGRKSSLDEQQPSLPLPSPPPPPPPEEEPRPPSQPEPPKAPEPEDDGGGSEEGEL